MSDTPVQLTFEGREVGAARFIFSALEFPHLPDGLSWEDVAQLQPGDHIEVTLRLAYNSPGGHIKVDRDNGVEQQAMTKVFGFTAYREGFKVNAIVSAADREKAWRESQGATA